MRHKIPLFLFGMLTFSFLSAQEPSFRAEKAKGYNPPSFLKLQNPWHLHSDLSFLYWQPKEIGTELGATKKNDLSKAGKVIPLHSRFKPGVQASLGISDLRDHWDIQAKYLHVSGREGKFFETRANEQLLPFWQHEISSSDSPSFSDAHWVLHMNMADLEVARPCFTSPKISLTPFFSFRTFWFHQRYNVFYTYEEGMLFSHLKSRAYLLGPHLGARSSFHLIDELAFLANVGATLGVEHYKTQMESNFLSGADLLPFSALEKHWQVTPSLDYSLGLQWGSYFYRKKGHVTLSLLYEFLYFWNQNAMRQLKDTTTLINGSFPHIVPESGDLFFQGLTVLVALDF